MFNKRIATVIFSGGISVAIIIICILNLNNITPTHAQNIIYVKEDASNVNPGGASWADAYPYLQDALAVANVGDEIWVATGTYKPSKTNNPAESFTLPNGVALYGGFAGTETIREERNWQNNKTILSGDLLGNDIPENVTPEESTREDNSYHVVITQNATNDTILDGFTITGGNTDTQENSPNTNDGGGMFNINSSPLISHVTFIHNVTRLNDDNYGGGLYNRNSNPTLYQVSFENNQAVDGGGIYNVQSHPTLDYVTFTNNYAEDDGGGMSSIENSSPILNHVDFISNTANSGGGGMHNDDSIPQLTNVSFMSNTANEDGGGMHNNDSDAVISNVILFNNSADEAGGGIYNTSEANTEISRTIIISNTARSGGGIYNDNSNPTIQFTMISNNKASNGYGGGINNTGSDPVISNSTISGNQATRLGGAIYNDDIGNLPPFSDDPSNATLNHVTIFNNSALAGGGGIENDSKEDDNNNTVLIKNSILAGNKMGNNIASDCFGDLDSYGYNIIENVDNCQINSEENIGTNLPGQDPLLSALSYYNDIPLSYLPSENSPAIDNGSCLLIDESTILDDQRNFIRPFGDNCDIGAIEWAEFRAVLPIIYHNYANTYFFAGPFEQEPNDLPPNAVNGPLISGQNYYGRFPNIDDNSDYYSIVLARAHTIKIWLTDIPAGENYDLTLRDSSNLNDYLAHSGELGNTSEYIETGILPAGRYYIQVSNRQDTGNGRYYKLRVVYKG